MYDEYQNTNWEVYDLVTDHYELKSVVTKPANAALVASLKAKLKQLKLQ